MQAKVQQKAKDSSPQILVQPDRLFPTIFLANPIHFVSSQDQDHSLRFFIPFSNMLISCAVPQITIQSLPLPTLAS